MEVAGADQTLAYLLDFDGEAIVYGGGYVARFRVRRIGRRPRNLMAFRIR